MMMSNTKIITNMIAPSVNRAEYGRARTQRRLDDRPLRRLGG